MLTSRATETLFKWVSTKLDRGTGFQNE